MTGRCNEVVPLEFWLEHQILVIAARTGASRAEVIQECVRDRLKGGTFSAPFCHVKQSGRSEREGGTSSDRPDTRSGTEREAGVA